VCSPSSRFWVSDPTFSFVLDVYIECTVRNPRHVTRKRRKVREAARRLGIVITTRERADFERLHTAYGPGARADATRATIGSAKASPSA
jgi:hypothetical protein